jgi:hypothetical protein
MQKEDPAIKSIVITNISNGANLEETDETNFDRYQVIQSANRGCRAQPSNRKWSDKSKRVSFNSTPTLDTQTVPIAAKKKRLSTCPPQFCD